MVNQMTDVGKLPQELKETGLFCLWRYEQRGERRTKVPYDPRTGRMAGSNDPGTFAPLETALLAEQTGYDGLGVGIFGDVCAIDIDHCVNEDGSFTRVGMNVMMTMNSYTEYSPSGKGLRILFKAPGFQYDKAAWYINNARLGLEIYVAGATNKYVTVTGNRLAGSDAIMKNCSAQLLQVLDMYMRREPAAQTELTRVDGLLSLLRRCFAKPGSADDGTGLIKVEVLEEVSSPTAIRPSDMRGGAEGLAQQGSPCPSAPVSAARAEGPSVPFGQRMCQSTSLTDAFSDLQLLDKAFGARNGVQFDALYQGNTAGYPSHSEADLALCGKLAFWTGCDKTQMDRMFRASGLMRADKWDRQQSGSTYGAITIDRALRDSRETYNRGGNH
jgi:hypothetical protein